MVKAIQAEPMGAVLDRHGITRDKLASLLKAEIRAKSTKTMKVKGAVSPASLPRGVRVIAATGEIRHGQDGDDFGDGNTLLSWNEVAWDVRQKARMDAHKLRGDYPSERVDHTVGLDASTIDAILSALPSEFADAVMSALMKGKDK
jgi:hypothetical protein